MRHQTLAADKCIPLDQAFQSYTLPLKGGAGHHSFQEVDGTTENDRTAINLFLVLLPEALELLGFLKRGELLGGDDLRLGGKLLDGCHC